ncbi:N-terminal EF-hand calcium-binding protein 1 isoform X2 [Pezoporus wallicus]|uniref:N-terminal EF-hand calcium-binding protein 1 isoform X2 n=1 Tax=Pezoporus wallicus TaxID=35540 RepID=UPI00254C112A|nr:N-terminal EF-hand calcium-binding protein 1 isoform X2 [Pezoporus wallicus]
MERAQVFPRAHFKGATRCLRSRTAQTLPRLPAGEREQQRSLPSLFWVLFQRQARRGVRLGPAKATSPTGGRRRWRRTDGGGAGSGAAHLPRYDGKLSCDEFKAYFADGILSGEELHELFHTIDTHNNDNLDTEELCEYFSQHLGEYENVLSVLEDLNITILKAMDKTKKDYQKGSNLEQFVTRFLLKETLNQLQSLQSSVECAMETTEEQTRQERQDPAKPEVLSIQWPGKHSARRLQRKNSLSPNSLRFSTGWMEENGQWMTQINRLQNLIDRLEKKDLKLEPFEEEVLEENARSHIMIVQRQMSVIEEEIEEFRLALKQYVESASAQGGCLHHLQMNYSKTFQRSNVDFLETPEIMTTMLVPASWWVLNNN